MASIGFTSGFTSGFRSSRRKPAPANNFLVALVRRGASVIADVPTDLPDQAVDPDPQPGWQRISTMCNAEVQHRDSLLTRACRYVVVLPLAYRAFAAPALLLAYLAAFGAGRALPVVLVAVFTTVCNLATCVWVLRKPGLGNKVAQPLLVADGVTAFAVNLILAATMPAHAFPVAAAVSWVYLLGTVALWTLAWGVPAGLFLIAAGIPLHVLMGVVNGSSDDVWGSPSRLVSDVLGLLTVLVTAVVVLMLIGLGVRLALGVGLRRGRQAEHARSQRVLHDTVLQTLEAMALPLPGRPGDLDTALAELAQLRGIARSQAMELRRSLAEPGELRSASLDEDLAGLAAEMAREGLRAQLVFLDADGGALSEERRIAVRDAVREAMRNTMKHAGTADVVLRVEQRDGGIEVVARDHGEGFHPDQRPPGFGISHSISARLAEVGGSARVESEPGRGTKVTLWVPL